jgi:murein DD-endopeptidase MepM/ murein hydrolase activator NlpD
VSPANNYKKLEKEIVDNLGKKIRLVLASVVLFFKFLVRKGRQRFTVMFIPHSEKPIFNFHISVFSLIFFICLIIVLVISFFGLSTHFTTTNKRFTSMSNNLKNAEVNLDVLREEIIEVERVWKEFRHQMEEMLQVMGTEEANQYLQKGVGGDLSSFLSIESVEEGSTKEISELRSLKAYLKSATKPIAEMTTLLKSQKELLYDIPTLWPVSGGKGNITGVFGLEEHPFTHGFRLHNGVDIAWGVGTPILATANGKVHSIFFQANGLGHGVILRHKYGFFTVYGHLRHAVVKMGEEVVRGQTIGYLGNSGLSTGPHLHYEVRMGTQAVDPMHFLDIKSPLVQKISHNR